MSIPSGPYYILSNRDAVGLPGNGPAPEPVSVFPFDGRMHTLGRWQVDRVEDSPQHYRLTVVDKHTGAAGVEDGRVVLASGSGELSAIDWVLRQVGGNKYQIQDPATKDVWVAPRVFLPVLLRPSGGDSANEVFDFIPINDLD